MEKLRNIVEVVAKKAFIEAAVFCGKPQWIEKRAARFGLRAVDCAEIVYGKRDKELALYALRFFRAANNL